MSWKIFQGYHPGKLSFSQPPIVVKRVDENQASRSQLCKENLPVFMPRGLQNYELSVFHAKIVCRIKIFEFVLNNCGHINSLC